MHSSTRLFPSPASLRLRFAATGGSCGPAPERCRNRIERTRIAAGQGRFIVFAPTEEASYQSTGDQGVRIARVPKQNSESSKYLAPPPNNALERERGW